MQYQVNIQISAGDDFQQAFYITDEDLSPVDITGFTFYANLSKHAGSLNVAKSTSDDPVWRYIPFTTAISNAANGEYVISLPATTTTKLKEGKYVYNVVLEDLSNSKREVVSGLAFVDRAFGYLGDYGSLDPDYP